MTKKIFIHIGTYKTGTSAIQHEAFTSTELEVSGVRYVRTGLNKRFEKHLRVYDSIIHDECNARRRSGPNYIEFEAIKKKLIKEITSGEWPCYLISEEELSFPSPLIAESLAFLKELGEVSVLLVVRRQDYFLDSLYRQFVREEDRGINLPFMEFIQDDLVTKRADFHAIASYWASVFGKDSVRMVDLERLRKSDCLVMEFFRWSGIPYLPKKVSDIVNPSLSAAEAEVIRRIALRLQVNRGEFASILIANQNKYASTFLDADATRTILSKYLDCNKRLEEYGVAFAAAEGLLGTESQNDKLSSALKLEGDVADAELFLLEHFMNKVSAAKAVLC